MRPIVEIQFSDFTCQAMDQIVNQAAKIHFMLGGAAQVPMVLRAPLGSGTGAAAQHSQSLEAWFAHVPGLKVVMPSTAEEVKGLLLAAIDDPNPVIFLEHKLLYRTSGPVPEGSERIPLGRPPCAAPVGDLTIVATGVMVSRCLEAAETLAAEGIDVVRPRPAHPHARSTPSRSSTTSPAPVAPCSSRRPPAMSATWPRSPRASSSHRRSSGCSRRSVGCAGSTRPSPTPRSSRPPSVPQVDAIVDAARTMLKES